MKGIPLFASVENPQVGDVVFWTKDDNMIRKPWTIAVVLENNEVLLEWVHDQAVKVSDLQRVVIEYNELEKMDESEISSKFFPSPIKKSVPLFKDDYKTIIRLISRTVDFGILEPGIEYGFNEFASSNADVFIPEVPTGKLFVVQNTGEENWADVIQKFKDETGSSAFATNAFASWLMKNYNAPKKNT